MAARANSRRLAFPPTCISTRFRPLHRVVSSQTVAHHRSKCRRNCDTRGRVSRSTCTRIASVGADERTNATLGDLARSAARGVQVGYRSKGDANSPGRTGADRHLLGADDGIRTQNRNLGKVDRVAQ